MGKRRGRELMAGPRLLYHAVGGGLGHGLRALALARQLFRRLGGRHRIVVNTSFSPALAAGRIAEVFFSNRPKRS